VNLAVERVGADGADEFVEIRGRGDASQLSVGLTRREKKKSRSLVGQNAASLGMTILVGLSGNDDAGEAAKVSVGGD